ncbi:MAG: DUF1127 domain-containing protein [Proteobacteria bacterium]|nr:DUF1127 domain-containing protein [Pseudomonadota bacterium]
MPFDQSPDDEPRRLADLWPAHSGTPRHGTKRGLFGTVRRWIELSRGRRELARLDDHLLKDIGVSRDEAESEACRWFWDDPEKATSEELERRFGHQFVGQLLRLRSRPKAEIVVRHPRGV